MSSETLAYASPKPAPPPVDGLVIRRSPAKTLIGLVLNALLFLFGAFLVWGRLKHVVLDPAAGPKHVTNWGLLWGVIAMIITPIASYRVLRAFRVRQRLVIAPDRLQAVERVNGEDTVTLQIPYANVADVHYEVTRTERVLGITLRDVDDPDTYPDAAQFKGTHRLTGRHYLVPNGYAQSQRAIAAAIGRAYVAWGGQLGPTGTGADLSDAGPTTAARVLSLVALVTCLVPLVGVVTTVLAIRAARRTEGWPKALNLLSLIVSIAVTVCVALLWVISR